MRISDWSSDVCSSDLVYIVHIPSNRPARLRQHVGARMPAHAASTGYVLLAYQDEIQRNAYLAQAPFPAFTPKTPVTAEALQAHFTEVIENGYGIAEDAISFGNIAIAVPVREHHRRPLAPNHSPAASTPQN